MKKIMLISALFSVIGELALATDCQQIIHDTSFSNTGKDALLIVTTRCLMSHSEENNLEYSEWKMSTEKIRLFPTPKELQGCSNETIRQLYFGKELRVKTDYTASFATGVTFQDKIFHYGVNGLRTGLVVENKPDTVIGHLLFGGLLVLICIMILLSPQKNNGLFWVTGLVFVGAVLLAVSDAGITPEIWDLYFWINLPHIGLIFAACGLIVVVQIRRINQGLRQKMEAELKDTWH